MSGRVRRYRHITVSSTMLYTLILFIFLILNIAGPYSFMCS